MALDHFISPTAPDEAAMAVRLGAGSGTSNQVDTKEVGKIVKLAGESRYDLAVAGDNIEALIYAVEMAPQNGYSIGSVYCEGRARVTFDGLQATPGVGVISVGDWVVAGTQVPKGTALTTYPKVCKATSQGTQQYLWRVLSLGPVGTGAVGTVGVIGRD
jgi:hypothetical protein